MNYYRNYTAKKLKLPRRLIFFAVIAVLIFIFSVILGNNLKKRLAEADINKDPVETVDLENIEKEQKEQGGNAVHETLPYSAGFLTLTGEDDASSAKNKIYAVKTAGYTCVSFVCCDAEGLKYASPAMSELSRLPASETVADYSVLCDALAYAKSVGMRTSAVFLSRDAETDGIILAELCSAGFDEIIIRGFEGCLTSDGGDINEAVKYLGAVREKTECDIALALMPAAYTYARNSYHIEKLFTYTEFLSVDMTESTAEDARGLADGFAGSFSTYSLRALITHEQTDVEEALASAGFDVCQYISAEPDNGGDDE